MKNISRVIAGVSSILLLTACVNTSDNNQPVPLPDTEETLATETTTATETTLANLQNIKLAFVLLEDNGVKGKKIGCGDSLVIQDTSVQSDANSPEAFIKSSLEELFKANAVDPYYTVSKQPGLTVNTVINTGTEYLADVAGALTLNGVCDNPRLIEQIRATASQLNLAKPVTVMLNGKTLEEATSQK